MILAKNRKNILNQFIEFYCCVKLSLFESMDFYIKTFSIKRVMRFLLLFIPILFRKQEILRQLQNPNITEYDKLVIIRKNRDLIDYLRKN